MTDRRKIIQDLVANHPPCPPDMSLTSVLDALKKAGYDVVKRSPLANDPSRGVLKDVGEPPPAPSPVSPPATYAQLERMAERAKREGAALALRALERRWYGTEPLVNDTLTSMADRIEKGEPL